MNVEQIKAELVQVNEQVQRAIIDNDGGHARFLLQAFVNKVTKPRTERVEQWVEVRTPSGRKRMQKVVSYKVTENSR